MSNIVNILIHKGFLKTDAIIDAFAAVPRTEFMPQRFRSVAEADIPIPLGYGQMMASPSIIAYMLELLMPQKGDKILIVGFGSGWVGTVLSYIVGQSGHVVSCDQSDAIEKDARANMAKFAFLKEGCTIDLYTIAGCSAIPRNIAYNRIIVLNPAFADCAFEEWMAEESVLVTPRKNVIHRYERLPDGEMDINVYNGMQFLPIEESVKLK